MVHEVALHSQAGGRRYLDELWERVEDCSGWTGRSPGLGWVRFAGQARRAAGRHVRTVTFDLSYAAAGSRRASVVVAQDLGVVSTLIVYGQWPATERTLALRRLTERLAEAAQGVRT